MYRRRDHAIGVFVGEVEESHEVAGATESSEHAAEHREPPAYRAYQKNNRATAFRVV